MPQRKNSSGGALTINRFLLYAERSITLGQDCHFEGDLGVRWRVDVPSPAGAAQISVGKHTRCRSLYAPSTSLAKYCEVHDVWTGSLHRAEDIGIGAEHAFPSAMPVLPLAIASGQGGDITLHRHEHGSLGPGVYGALTLLYESELRLAAGAYVFASIQLDERARLLALPGGVSVGVIGGLSADRHARIDLHRDDEKASEFSISVAGSNLGAKVEPGIATGTPVVQIGEEAHLHALLAAPHGTARVKSLARIKGALAAFDIVADDGVHAQFQSGFPVDPPGQQGAQQLSGYLRAPAPAPPLLGPVPRDTQIWLGIGLPVRDPNDLNDLIKQVSDPKHANFRKFISQAEFNGTYGATDADYQTLKNWADANGFTTVATYSNNLLLTLSATAAVIERALFVNLHLRERRDGSLYIAVDRDPSLNLSVLVLDINGLNDFHVARAAGDNTGPKGSYAAADLRNAYLGVGSPLQSLDGTGQIVGLVEFDIYNPPDIAGYANNQLAVAGQSPLPPPNVKIAVKEGDSFVSGNMKIETTMDVDMVYAMAPAAQILVFKGSIYWFSNRMADIFHSMATWSPPLTVASCSLSFNYSDSVNQSLGEMAVTGVTFFNASGDSGNIGPQDPGNLEFVNQTIVGGTTMHTEPLIQPPPNAIYPNPYYAYESTWNQGDGATSGGILEWIELDPQNGEPVLLNVPIPDYQVGVSMATNGGSTLYRNYPDVAMIANGCGIFIYGSPNSIGGTSLAAPLWAGFTALINQFNQRNGGAGKLGFINPTLYDIGLTRGTANDLYSVCFNNIADGLNNQVDGGTPGFTAVAGYNLCTGWGTPKPALIYQLGSPNPLAPNQPLSVIRFVITTGHDDAGGGLHGSSQTADCFLPGGGVFTLTLRTSGDANWQNWSTHVVDFPIPTTDNNGNPVPVLTSSQGLTGVRINLVQDNPNISADNWDIANLQVSLFDPGSPRVVQVDLIGTTTLQDGSIGLVRLSKNPGGSGSGPHSPIYPAPPAGTPLTPNQPLSMIRFVITTGNDDAGGGLHGSTQTADCFVPGGAFTVTLRKSSAAHWHNGETHVVEFSIPATDSNAIPLPVLTPTKGLTGIRINLVQDNPDISADNWDIANLRVSLFDPGSLQACQVDLIGTSVLQDGSIGLVRLSKNAGGSGNGPHSPIYPTGLSC